MANKIQCPICSDIGQFSMVTGDTGSARASDDFLLCESCGASFPIENGILNLLPGSGPQSSYWDRLYDEGIRGDPARRMGREHFVAAGLANVPSFLTYLPLARLINDLGIKFQSSIEIGCGSGYYSLVLKKLGLTENCILLDTSLTALKVAYQLFETFGESACFVVADGLRLPFIDKSFDLSLSGGLVEHFKGEEQRKLVSEHCRVAKTVACQVPIPSAFYWLQRGVLTLLNGKWPFGYERPVSLQKLENLFNNEGFQLRSVGYHDLITALLFRLSVRFRRIKPLEREVTINRLAKFDIAALFLPKVNPKAIQRSKQGATTMKNLASLPVGYWPSWDIGDRHKTIRLQSELNSLGKGSLKILDLGCGPGILDIAAASNGHMVWATDLSMYGLAILKETLNGMQESLQIHTLQDDGYYLPFKDKSFDVVLSSHVLEHLNRPKMFLEEASRVLKDNGYIFLYTPSDYHRARILKLLRIARDPPDHVVEGFSLEGIKNLLPIDLQLIKYEYNRRVYEANMVDIMFTIGKIMFGTRESASQRKLPDVKWLKHVREIFISINLCLISIIDMKLFKGQKGAECNCVLKKVAK